MKVAEYRKLISRLEHSISRQRACVTQEEADRELEVTKERLEELQKASCSRASSEDKYWANRFSSIALEYIEDE